MFFLSKIENVLSREYYEKRPVSSKQLIEQTGELTLLLIFVLGRDLK